MALTMQSTTQLASVLPPAEARALFEQEARRLAGMSAEDFLTKWDAGDYRDLDDSPEGRRIAYLAMLIPFARQNS